MKIPLLFHRNIKHNAIRKLCPCIDLEVDQEKCLQKGSINVTYSTKGFKDESQTTEKYVSCEYRRCFGPSAIDTSKITKEEYNQMIQGSTYCAHPLEQKCEWECYRCGSIVLDERDRCRCSIIQRIMERL